jgi:RHS repeat-associated protein
VWNLSFNCQLERCTIGSMATAATAAVRPDDAPAAGAANDNAPPGAHETWNLNSHRYYDPAVGRYTQVDPLLVEGPPLDPRGCDGQCALLSYGYAGNNPVLFADPTGEYQTKNCSPADQDRVISAVGQMLYLLSKCSTTNCGQFKKILDWILSSDTTIECDRAHSGGRSCGHTDAPIPNSAIKIYDNGLRPIPRCRCLGGVIAHELGHSALGETSERIPRQLKDCVCNAGGM